MTSKPASDDRPPSLVIGRLPARRPRRILLAGLVAALAVGALCVGLARLWSRTAADATEVARILPELLASEAERDPVLLEAIAALRARHFAPATSAGGTDSLARVVRPDPDTSRFLSGHAASPGLRLLRQRIAHAGDEGLDPDSLHHPRLEALSASLARHRAAIEAHRREMRPTRAELRPAIRRLFLASILRMRPPPRPEIVRALAAGASDGSRGRLRTYPALLGRHYMLAGREFELEIEATRAFLAYARRMRVPDDSIAAFWRRGPQGMVSAVEDCRPRLPWYPALAASLRSARRSGDTAFATALRGALERSRRVPYRWSKEFIRINIPAFRLEFVDGGRTMRVERVIVGRNKEGMHTPLIASRLERVILNPIWYIPQTIFREELSPRIAADPRYFDTSGLVPKRDSQGRIVGAWQMPGDENVLGRVKLVFPNFQSIYMHGTLDSNLFKARRRAFSHGCIRLPDPLGFSVYLLEREANPGITKIPGILEKTVSAAISFQTPIPLFIEYDTVGVGDSGQAVLLRDVYEVGKPPEERVWWREAERQRRLKGLPPRDPRTLRPLKPGNNGRRPSSAPVVPARPAKPRAEVPPAVGAPPP